MPAAVRVIDRASPRAVFAEWVGEALARSRVQPSPMAVAYLIELLAERVRAPAAPAAEPTLAETLLRSRALGGARRLESLRGLGDRALFVCGFFAESLEGRPVGPAYYRDMGRMAYASLASALSGGRDGRAWPRLFGELADGFREFAGVLSEVGDRACPGGPERLLRLTARYLESGRESDRRRLMRRGVFPVSSAPRRRQ